MASHAGRRLHLFRRDNSAGFAGRIYDRLKMSLGRDNVFIDVDNIPAGRDFVEVLTERVGRCDALVALIGRNWLASADKDNRRRLDDPDDFVRIEIEAALERNVPVIPVLVDGAAMPQANDLPEGLKKLARRQGIEISHNRFDSDAERLTDALAQIDGEKPGHTPGAAAAPALAPAPKPAAGGARWVFIAATALIVIAAVAGFVYEQRGAHEEPLRQEERAKPTSDGLKTLPPPQTTSTQNNAAPSPAVVAAVPPPANIAPNATAPNEAPNGKAPTDSAPGAIAETATPATPTEWMNREDFSLEYDRRKDLSYPDKVWERCQNNAPQRSAHWSPRPIGEHFQLLATEEKDSKGTHSVAERDFKTSVREMTANGFKMQYDSVFEGCGGTTQHLTLWMKDSVQPHQIFGASTSNELESEIRESWRRSDSVCVVSAESGYRSRSPRRFGSPEKPNFLASVEWHACHDLLRR